MCPLYLAKRFSFLCSVLQIVVCPFGRCVVCPPSVYCFFGIFKHFLKQKPMRDQKRKNRKEQKYKFTSIFVRKLHSYDNIPFMI